jgi:cell wall-associated NlpC family hydrolase
MLIRTSGRHRPRRRSPRRPGRSGLRKPLWSALAVAVAIVGAVGDPPSGAQTIADLRDRAAALDEQLTETHERLEVLAEQYNQGQADLARAHDELAAAEAALAATQEEMKARQHDLREYAVRAYVDGGTLRELDGVLGGDDVDDASRRLTYLQSAVGNRKALLDRLKVSREDVQRHMRQVDEARQQAEGFVSLTEAAQSEARELEANQSDLLAQTKGELATLVAEAEAARQAAERQAAEDAAREAGLRIQTAPEPSPTRTVAADDAEADAAPASDARPEAPVVSAPRPQAEIAVNAALSQLGVPYVWAGASPSAGFDCSGLMYWAWGQAGRRIPRPADYQRDAAIPLSYEQLQPGDLVFYGEPVSHVAMYLGGDQIVDAPQTGEDVEIKTMWYSRKPMSYGRVA